MVPRGTAALNALATLQRLLPPDWLRAPRPEPLPLSLGRQRIFILPTRQGLTFALVLLAMLLGAINYDNSLVYALVFLLAGLAVISILHTYRTLAGLRLAAARCAPVFAGEVAALTLTLNNPDPQPRLAVTLARHGGPEHATDLAPGINPVVLPLATTRRGRLVVGRLILASRFPLGLFRAWAPLEPEIGCLVYPAPAAERGLPPPQPDRPGEGGAAGPGQDDFSGLRAYQTGDPLRHVHWKLAARGQGLTTKQFAGEQTRALWLDWALLPGLPVEDRLSRLCRWVLEAEAGGLPYGLRLPDRQLEPARGAAHRRRCLEALALFGEAP